MQEQILRITPLKDTKAGRQINLVFVDWFGKRPVAVIKSAMHGSKYCGAFLRLNDGTQPFYNALMLRKGKKTPTNRHVFPDRNAAKAYLKEHFSREFDGSYANWRDGCPIWSGYAKD